MTGRPRPAARRRRAGKDERGPAVAPSYPAWARSLPEAEPFDAVVSVNWFDDVGTRSSPPIATPPLDAESPFYLRTDVLAAGATLSVLLFLGLFGYALTRSESFSTTTKIPSELPIASAPVFALPVPPDPVDSLVSPPTPDPVPDSAAEDALPISVAPQTLPAADSPPTIVTPIAATSAVVTAVAPPTATTSVTTSSMTPAATPTTDARPARSAIASSTAASPPGSSGRFTGVILAIRGDVWSFGLWDGTIVSLHVTANTQLTPKASLLSAPRFVAGQTVAVFYRTAGAGTSLVADRIYAV